VCGMAYREFTDSAGVAWTVWQTVPTRPESFAPECRDGWLSFESENGRRRLTPIPKGWEDAALDRLELMCRAAEPIPRATPPRGRRISTELPPSEDSV